MANQYDEQDYEDDDEYEADEPGQRQQRTNAEWAELRQAKKAAKQAETKAQQAERELAFYKAGIPTDDPKMAYFIKGYEGKPEPEAIRQAAIEAGFMEAQAQSPEHQQAIQAQQRIAVAGSAGVPNPVGVEAALQGLDEAYEQGGVGAVLAAMQQAGIPLSDRG